MDQHDFLYRNISVSSLMKILVNFHSATVYYTYFPLEYRAHGFIQDIKIKTQAIH